MLYLDSILLAAVGLGLVITAARQFQYVEIEEKSEGLPATLQLRLLGYLGTMAICWGMIRLVLYPVLGE